jgi:superfamily II DNA or RNA helicase/predicted transcriptional regulator
MSRSIPFNQIVKAMAERAALQHDWNRQRATARAIVERFKTGHDAVLLADEVGMGKTYVALAVMANYLLQSERNDRKVLLITPPSHVLRHKWVEEIVSFNGKYVEGRQPGAERKDMRALSIGSYWDLFRNLNDYEDTTRLRVEEDTRLAFIFCMFSWAESRKLLGKQRRIWPAVQHFDEHDSAYLRFSAQYSPAAIWQFLDSEYAVDKAWFQEQFRLLKADTFQAWQLANRFKKFTRQQDRFEPNIYVMGMNGLRAPRIDEADNKLFSQFALGFLLSGLHAENKLKIVRALEGANVLPAHTPYARWQPYVDKVLATCREDMFGLRGATERVLQRSVISTGWKELRVQMMGGDAKPQPFFNELRNLVFQEKLAEANIGLAVIDEVHNWKAGAYNAKIFESQYAPFIPCKLIMSATPFQVEEGEMERVFNYVMDKERKSAVALRRIFDKEKGLMRACVQASNRFAAAWQALPAAPDGSALDPLLAATDDLEIRAIAGRIVSEGDTGEAIENFSFALLAYRDAIDQLQGELKDIVVRHTKPRDKRDFHIGEQFHSGHADGRPRPALYPSVGYADDDAAMVNFIGMRLGQLAERSAGKSRTANARLLGGIASSTSAYLKGASARNQDASHESYRAMFAQVLQNTIHPKVDATVTRAFDNFLAGRKTLIFCERVHTLDEIKGALDKRIDAHHLGQQASDDAILRRSLMKRADLVDNLWWISLCDAAGQSTDFTAHLAFQEGEARAFAQACLTAAGLKQTARRVIRLLDVHLLAHTAAHDTQLAQRWPQALELFRGLNEVLAGGPCERRDTVLQAYLNGTGQQEGERIDEIHDSDEEDSTAEVERMLRTQYVGRQNLWCAQVRPSFHQVLWNLLDSEAAKLLRGDRSEELPLLAFVDIVSQLMAGLKKVVLREDLIARYEGTGVRGTHFERISAGFATMDVGHGETMLMRTQRFVESLVAEDGSISQADQRESKRKSMWSGISRSTIEYVSKLEGKTNPESRVRLCASFNSPLLPDILICSAIGSEGIDLHRHCADIIHHDLPWNPAKLEQRIGRLDRVNSLANPDKGVRINIGIPFLANNYEKYQYDVVFSRAQKFEVLLGTPDFDGLDIEEEVYGDGAGLESVRESCDDEIGRKDEFMRALPEAIIRFLKVNLAVFDPAES